jgi:hypothetical protein
MTAPLGPLVAAGSATLTKLVALSADLGPLYGAILIDVPVDLGVIRLNLKPHVGYVRQEARIAYLRVGPPKAGVYENERRARATAAP